MLKALLLCLAIAQLIYGHAHSPQSLINVPNVIMQRNENVTLQVSRTLLTNPGADWVTVSFSGVSAPSNGDWVGAYAYPIQDFSTKAPTRYQFANVSSQYNETGSGSIRFHLINIRSSFVFGFMTNGTDYPILVATSPVVSFANPNEPTQGRLALHNLPDHMRIMWGGGGNVVNRVQYGTNPSNLNKVAFATRSTYTPDDMCGSPAKDYGWIDPGTIHDAVMGPLLDGQTYHYRYGSDDHGWSPIYNFSAPTGADPTRGIKVVAFGDMGRGNLDGTLEHWEMPPALKTTAGIFQTNSDADFLLHIGDVSYAVGYAADWDQFGWQMLPLATHVPYMTGIGNHERDFPDSGSFYNGTDSGGECGVPYNRRYRMPHVNNDSSWYSFNYGNTHFVVMSTEHNFNSGSLQHEFLRKDLESVNREMTPYVVFTGHRPMYVDSQNNGSFGSDISVMKLLIQEVEPLLVKYHVDLALWGHHHSYQRMCHVMNSECGSQDLPRHVIIGMAGAEFTRNTWPLPPKFVQVVDVNHHGFSVIQTNSTHLHFKYIINELLEIQDEFVIQRKNL